MKQTAARLVFGIAALAPSAALAASHPIADVVAKGVAEFQVKRYLRDPDSAKFSDIHGADLPSVPGTEIQGWSVICGVVNSRNGFGGYSGPERFIVIVMSATDAEVDFEHATRKRDFAKSWALCEL
jgi:hypothetical protein